DYQERADFFDGVSGIYPTNNNLTDVDEPERIEGQLVSANYFSILGVEPQIGRLFLPEDYQPGISEVAVISDSLWKRRFGGNPSVIGKKLRLDNDLYTVIGVLPPGFRHPGQSIQGDCEVWSPCGYRAAPFRAPVRGINLLNGALARLKPGLTVEAAQAR